MGEEPIQAVGLGKTYGKKDAVADLSLDVPRGSLLGLLGPNGAGKTTTVRMLTTLTRPSAGWARVDGHDVVANPAAVRSAIGLAGQFPAVDTFLTGKENLEQVAQLHHLGRAETRRRTDELLQAFDITVVAGMRAGAYSGGQRRRLDLAASLIGQPSVLFLDEPTAGLDPRGRIELLGMIRRLTGGGITVLLTTQYLDEADQLADRILVMDAGRTIAEGTPDELKSRVGGDRLELRVADSADAASVAAAVRDLATEKVTIDADHEQVLLPVTNGVAILPEVVRRLDRDGLRLSGLSVRRPSLDDVFLAVTGKAAQAGQVLPEPAGRANRPGDVPSGG